MVKSYFQLYKKAKKLFDNEKIKITDVRDNPDKTTYFFQANGYTVTLDVTQVPNTRLWLRHWSCGCAHYSLWQDKTECYHIKGCEYYLMNGGYNGK